MQGTVARRKRHRYDATEILQQLGISSEHAEALLRIAGRLHRWHERECGDERGGIQRNDDGTLSEYSNMTHQWTPYRGPDHETNALARLTSIMANYPTLRPYVQGDPRGCALYILRPGDVPEGERPDAYYSRGIPVYRE